MALVTINEVAVLAGSIMMPIKGVWTADLVIDQPDGTGFGEGTAVTISSPDLDLVGTVAPFRTGDFLDAVHVRVIGGAGGMGKDATPKSYAQPGAYVRDVLRALCSDSGETLSDGADQSFTQTNLVAWSVIKSTVSNAVQTLIDIVNETLTWRILPDGKLWIGAESWPRPEIAVEVLEHNPTDGTYNLGVQSLAIVPGIEVADVGKVNRVEHQIYPNIIRSHVWTNQPDTDRGIKGAVTALVSQAIAGIDYFTLYDAKVVSQSADLTTVDLQPIDTRLPGYGRVPLRYGLPGTKVQVSSGSILRLGWDRGSPALPYAALWNGGETVQSIQLAGNTNPFIPGSQNELGTLTLTVAGSATLAWTYVDANGNASSGASGAPITLTGKKSSIVGVG